MLYLVNKIIRFRLKNSLKISQLNISMINYAYIKLIFTLELQIL